ncbi:MAG TPA: L,D-transpeptidase family protein [Candidatus Aquicultor sp.]|jgi:peptidoglycan hydrolase-like protein with peptidoglycan-binding domain
MGSRGADVIRLQRRLTELGYNPGAINGRYNMHSCYAVVAFQKVNGLSRDGAAGKSTLRALSYPKIIKARYKGDHVEVNKALQVLLIVRGGKVTKIFPVSTGRHGHTTPSVTARVYSKPGYQYRSKKYDGIMTWTSFFYSGVAVHGYPSVPTKPASHGCVRVPIVDCKYIYNNMPMGSLVYVY